MKTLLVPCAALGLSVGTASADNPPAEQSTSNPVIRFEGTEEELRRLGYPQESTTLKDGANDPRGLVPLERLSSLRELAAQLSRDDAWLTQEALDALDDKGRGLNELFSRTSGLVSIDGKQYRVTLEKFGPEWKGFRLHDTFIIYLTHEVFDGTPDAVLAFRGGTETLLTAEELLRVPALSLLLTEDASARPEEPVTQMGASIPLGPVRPEAQLAWMRQLEQPAPSSSLDSCAPEVAPVTCWNNVPLCPGGYSPYFVAQSILIKTDHEGAFKGNPEIELFPLRLDSVSMAGGYDDARTDWIFDGRTVADLAGRNRYLPNIQNNNQWYSVSGGLAVFPNDLGQEWSATLVEQDDEQGVLKVKATKVNVTKIYKRVSQIVYDIREAQYFHLVKTVFKLLLDIIKAFDDGDDIYQQSIGISNELFCNDGVGQPFPKQFSMDSNEWSMRGYFACVNPACAPPPPPPPPPPPGCFAREGLLPVEQCN